MNPGLRGAEGPHTADGTGTCLVCIGDARTDYSEHFSAFQT